MDNLINHIIKRVAISEKKKQLIVKVAKKKSLAKKDVLLHAGEICSILSYVNKGCLRVYSVDENGFDKNVFFALEDWWVIDLKSFIEQSPARFSIEALEDCELIQLTKEGFDKLLTDVPELERWFRMLLQNALIASENRINNMVSLDAEERYLKFMDKYPSLESRVSQKHIASYLGVSPEFLSALKAKLLRKLKS